MEDATPHSLLQALFNPRKVLSAAPTPPASADSSTHPTPQQPSHAPPPAHPQGKHSQEAAAAAAVGPRQMPQGQTTGSYAGAQQRSSLASLASTAATPALAAASALASTGLFERFGLRAPAPPPPDQPPPLQQQQQQQQQPSLEQQRSLRPDQQQGQLMRVPSQHQGPVYILPPPCKCTCRSFFLCTHPLEVHYPASRLCGTCDRGWSARGEEERVCRCRRILKACRLCAPTDCC